MLAKIKDGAVVTFPYGYDNLQAENPHTRFTGDINLLELFPQTEEALLRGYALVQVTVKDKPRTRPIEEAIEATVPVLEDGQWVLGWDVRWVKPL